MLLPLPLPLPRPCSCRCPALPFVCILFSLLWFLLLFSPCGVIFFVCLSPSFLYSFLISSDLPLFLDRPTVSLSNPNFFRLCSSILSLFPRSLIFDLFFVCNWLKHRFVLVACVACNWFWLASYGIEFSDYLSRFLTCCDLFGKWIVYFDLRLTVSVLCIDFLDVRKAKWWLQGLICDVLMLVWTVVVVAVWIYWDFSRVLSFFGGLFW